MQTDTQGQLTRTVTRNAGEFEPLLYPCKGSPVAKIEDFETSFQALVDAVHKLEEAGVSYEQLECLLLPALRQLMHDLHAWLKALPAEAVAEAGEAFRERFAPQLREGTFGTRALYKPLGYAGDYDMVCQIWSNAPTGTAVGKLIDRFLLSGHPSVAHRNRILMLEDHIQRAYARARAEGRPCRVLNVGCGPAIELCNFLRHNPGASGLEVVLMDFNQETLDFARTQIEVARVEAGCQMQASFVLRSVLDVIKERGCLLGGGFDLVYCAGLYDYLNDRVCGRLNGIFYDSVRPGGSLVVTNVLSECYGLPVMTVMLDWTLITRSAEEMRQLVPTGVDPGSVDVRPDPTQGNVLLILNK